MSNNIRTIKIKNNLRDIPGTYVGRNKATVVKVNFGVTKGYSSLRKELNKIREVVKYDIDLISDVTISNPAEIKRFHQTIVSKFPIPLCSVPYYELYLKKRGDKVCRKDVINIFEDHAKRGVDLVTLHASMNLLTYPTFLKNKRYVQITSRGGGLAYEYIKIHKAENPLVEYFDDILSILKKYQVTLSLAFCFRPGCICDGVDELVEAEIEFYEKIIKKAHQNNINVIAEIGGHIRVSELKNYMKMIKRKTDGAILSVMGPMVTDISIGHDNITSSIGNVLAGLEGADMLLAITPSEHIGLPIINDIKEGVISAKIAAHIIDTYKLGAIETDKKVGYLRKINKRCFMKEGRKFLLDPFNPIFKKISASCSMCGNLCPLKKMLK